MTTGEFIALTMAILLAGYFVLDFAVFRPRPGPPLGRRVLKLLRRILDAFWGAG